MLSDFAEAVLAYAETIPSGRVTTYGAIAEALGRGGARNVGQVMSAYGHGVPWWRVVRANGSLPDFLIIDAQQYWADEGTPVIRGRVDIEQAFWAG